MGGSSSKTKKKPTPRGEGKSEHDEKRTLQPARVATSPVALADLDVTVVTPTAIAAATGTATATTDTNTATAHPDTAVSNNTSNGRTASGQDTAAHNIDLGTLDMDATATTHQAFLGHMISATEVHTPKAVTYHELVIERRGAAGAISPDRSCDGDCDGDGDGGGGCVPQREGSVASVHTYTESVYERQMTPEEHGVLMLRLFPRPEGEALKDRVPLNISVWFAHDDSKAIGDDKAKVRDAVAWLADSLIHAHIHRDIKTAARRLLRKQKFTTNLQFADSWEQFKEPLRTYLTELSKPLQEYFEDQNLEVKCGNQVIEKVITYHEKFAKSPSERHLPGMPAESINQAHVVPVLPGTLDFAPESTHKMHERVFTHAIIMLGMAVNSLFCTKMTSFAALYNLQGYRCQFPAPKAFSRANNKSNSDYYFRSSPKGGHNLDVIRCMLVPDSTHEMMQLLQDLTTYFGDGIAKLKNLFALDGQKRAERFGLLSLMVTVVFETGLTYRELSEQAHTRGMWDAYCQECPDGSEPKERWVRLSTQARDYLEGDGLADTEVVMFAEVQILLHRYLKMRHNMHEVYMAYRAHDPVQLHKDYLRTSLNRSDLMLKGDTSAKSLFNAAHYGQLGVVAQLLAAQGDVNKRASNDRTPLFTACENGHVDVAHMLVESGSDIEFKCLPGWRYTPFFIACWKQHYDVLRMLYDAGADVNAASESTQNPIYNAVRNNHCQLVQFLIELGADVNKSTTYGTPLERARSNHNQDVIDMLLAAGATA